MSSDQWDLELPPFLEFLEFLELVELGELPAFWSVWSVGVWCLVSIGIA